MTSPEKNSLISKKPRPGLKPILREPPAWLVGDVTTSKVVEGILQRLAAHGLTADRLAGSLSEAMLFATPVEAGPIADRLLGLIENCPETGRRGWGLARVRAFGRVGQPEAAKACSRRGVLQGWVKLSDAVRTRALRALVAISREEVLEVLSCAHPTCVQSATKLLASMGEPAWADIAVKILLHGDLPERIIAERALVDWAVEVSAPELDGFIRRGLGLEAVERWSPAERDHVCGQVARAAVTVGQHGRSAVVLAASLLLSRERHWAAIRGLSGEGENALAEWFLSDSGPAHAALRGSIRTSPHPVMRQRAWEWVTRKDLRFACLDRLARSSGLYEHDTLLARTHLMSHPGRVLALRSVPSASWMGGGVAKTAKAPSARVSVPQAKSGGLLPRPAELVKLSTDAVRGMPRLVSALLDAEGRSPASVAATEELLASVLGHTDGPARHAAMRATSPDLLNDWCLDDSEPVARGAAMRRELAMRRRTTHAQIAADPFWRTLERSPHESVRGIAAGALRDRETNSVRVRQAWRKAGGDETLAALRSQLTSVSAGDRLEALALARSLRLVPELTDEIQAVATAAMTARTTDPLTPRVAATAVAALGEGKVESPVLRVAVSAGDARVRANAIEAIVRVQRRATGVGNAESCRAMLVEYKNDPHHRVRANAVRSLWSMSPSQAGEDLCRMLRDERPAHRLAGAWAAGRAAQSLSRLLSGPRGGSSGGSGSGGREVQDIWSVLWAQLDVCATDDADASVRARAARAIELIPADAINAISFGKAAA